MTANKNDQTGAPLDLGAWAKEHNLDVSIQSPEDPLDAKLRRKKDFILFCFALFVLVVLVAVALVSIFGPNSSVDDKKWGLAFISSLGSALVAYLVGKKSA